MRLLKFIFVAALLATAAHAADSPDYHNNPGGITVKNIAAPGNPSSGNTNVYSDSTDKRLHDKNDAGVIGTTIVSSSCAANNFVISVSTAGVITCGTVAWSGLTGIPANVTTLGSFASTGLYAITGAGTSAGRTLQATSSGLSWTNGDGVAGNPSLGGILGIQSGGTSVSLGATGGAHQVLQQASLGGNVSVGQLACTDLSGVAASCSTDATNASNISSGTLAAARGGAGTVSGALKGNGSGAVSQAACADLSNGSASCSTDTTNASNITSGTAGCEILSKAGILVVHLISANLNSTADQAMTPCLATGTTLYRLNGVFIDNPSISMTTAVCGVWTAAGKTGFTILGSGASGVAMSGLTTNAVNTNGALIVPATNAATVILSATTLYFACSTAQGATATADVTITINPLN